MGHPVAESRTRGFAELPARLRDVADKHHAELAAGCDALPALDELPGDAARVLACSDFVAQSYRRAPQMLEEALATGDLATSLGPGNPGEAYRERTARAVAEAQNESQLMAALRRLKRREMVRIAWRDIGGLAGLDETVRDTSAFADAVLEASVEKLHAWQCAALGEPRSADGTVQPLIVVGLGKLGAAELNFSSDIDLVFAFPEPGETGDGRRSLTNDEFFVRLGRRLINVLGKRTEEGFVFRVDMRLRPFGASGPLALSFDALEHYYQSHGRDWERYALIRARPITGPAERGEELLERLRPFVYRRYLDFGALESIRSMKTLITEEIARKGLENDIKLGPGGIREIEFTGQAFQMVRGGRQPELRDRRILAVLARLGDHDLLPAYAVDQLSAAYRFLRTTEHRLQQAADRQLHTLPEDDPGRARLAAGLGFADWPAFTRVLERHRQHVASHFAQVFGGADDSPEADSELLVLWAGSPDAERAADILAAQGFADGESAWRDLARFRDSYTLRLLDERGRERLARLMPDLLRAVAARHDPSTTLRRVLDVLETIARRSSYLALLVERPLALSQLVRLCAASPWIARQLGRHPLLLDELLDPRSLYRPLHRHGLEADLEQRLASVAAGDVELEMEVLRQFKEANVLHVAAADVVKAIPLMVVSDHLTAIAEVALGKVLELAWRDVTARYGEPRREGDDEPATLPFAIAAYGKLGGIELGYGSDLDIVFLRGDGGRDGMTQGPKRVENAVFFTRLGQRIIHYLTTFTAAGTLYQLDFRLRPSGSKGLLVNGIEALRSYLFEEAWTWEHQALVRARVVAGDEGLAVRFAEIRREVLLVERDPDRLRDEVREMRERMRRELGSGNGETFDVKQDPGGIADIEFMVQYIVLRWASRLGVYLDFTDNIRLLEGFAMARLLGRDEVRFLTDAYRTYRGRVHELALQEQSKLTMDGELASLREGVLRIWQEVMGS